MTRHMQPCTIDPRCWRSDGHDGPCEGPMERIRRVEWPMAEDDEACRQLAEALPLWWAELVGVDGPPLHTDSQETRMLLRRLRDRNVR